MVKKVGSNVARLRRHQRVRKNISGTSEQVVFDRGGYVYHGRVAALAEGAREGGLEF